MPEAVEEYDGSNALQKRYVFAPGIDQPIVEYPGSGTGTRAFLSADERGSIIARSDSRLPVYGEITVEITVKYGDSALLENAPSLC